MERAPQWRLDRSRRLGARETAMLRVIQWATVAARPGIITYNDIPVPTPRGLVS